MMVLAKPWLLNDQKKDEENWIAALSADWSSNFHQETFGRAAAD
jgi:hypothetical protein